MILIKPSTEILNINVLSLQLIELAGRTCYKSEDKITEYSAPEFAKMILKRGHESVIEHASATVKFICDRGVSHEIVRHRIASYSQESTRYCNYNKDRIAYIIPPWVNIEPGEYDITEDTGKFALENFTPTDCLWFSSIMQASAIYKALVASGWRPEQARSVLPNSLKTEIVMTCNLREWRHLFSLRCSDAAHPQMRELTIPLLSKFHHSIPIIFEDLHVKYCNK